MALLLNYFCSKLFKLLLSFYEVSGPSLHWGGADEDDLCAPCPWASPS